MDALRGLAAFAVVWYHFRLAYNFNFPISRNPLLALLLSGHQAVELFFVLSGYVLGMPHWQGRQMPYRQYLVRRFFRIYVPFFAALLLAWAFASHFLYSQLPLTLWFHWTWQSPLTWRLFVRQALLSMNPALNTAFWSLRIEVEFSLLLPVCCWLVVRLRPLGIGLLSVAMYVASEFVRDFDTYRTVRFFPMFFVGLLLSLHAQRLATWWGARSTAARAGLLVAALMLYLPVAGQTTEVADALTGLGAALIILCALHSARVSGVLRHAIPEYLGRVSYSLYLVHGTVLFALVNMFYGKMSRVPLACINCVCALAMAHVFCVVVEEPSMRLGKRLTAYQLPLAQRAPATII